MKARKIIVALVAALLGAAALAQTTADSILGEYYLRDDKNGDSKVRFTKNARGTYDCTIIWIKEPNDPATGKPWLDSKNPDKSLRTRPLVGTKIVEGISYSDGVWSGAKIYDPNRGLKANATIKLLKNGKLEVSGKILGIGETQVWDRL